MENKLARHLVGDNYKVYPFVDWTDRCTGKTTAHALSLISEALLNPGKSVTLRDPSGPNSTLSKGNFLYYVRELIAKLELEFMKVNTTNHTLTYELFESLEDKIRDIVRQELSRK